MMDSTKAPMRYRHECTSLPSPTAVFPFLKSLRQVALGALAVSAASFAAADPTLVDVQDFESGTLPSAWATGAQSGASIGVSTDTSKTYDGSNGSLKATYPASDDEGTVYAWSVIDASEFATRELYIEFWAKMPGVKHGLKFLKIFGETGPSGEAANTTFGLDYTGVDMGSLYQVSFGDGTTAYNDTQNVINLDGSYPDWIGRSYGTASVSTPQNSAWASSNWGTDWHHFRFHVKFNSGTSAATEVADGEYYVEIDGVTYVDATGLLNRHYSNGPIERVELLGYSRGAAAPFEIWYDNVVVTTDGFEPGC